MKKNLFVFFFAAVLSAASVHGQQPDRFAYAITDIMPDGAHWNYLRKLDLGTGTYSEVMLNGDDASLRIYNATSKKQLNGSINKRRPGTQSDVHVFSSGTAAMAYDKKNNRLYYTPMFVDELRYIDLNSMEVFFVSNISFTGSKVKATDQSNIITRMVIASDGNGYAMTNDARQLIRFSTDNKFQVTDLGGVTDKASVGGASIHDPSTGYGGDMIADDNGNLYVFTARNHVFKLNIESRDATHLGVISGLPASYTVNGAVVNDKNQIVVGTATKSASYFTVDPETLKASAYAISGTVWNSSDLANSNLLVTADKKKTDEKVIVENNVNSNISIFPNPVSEKYFVVRFNETEAGNYTIQVTDLTGRQVLQQSVNVSGGNQSQRVNLGSSVSKGAYLVKVADSRNKTVYTSKIVLQ